MCIKKRRRGILLILILFINGTLTVDITYSQETIKFEFNIQKKLDERMLLFEKAATYIKRDKTESLKQIDEDIVQAISFLDSWEQARRSVARGIRARTSPENEINKLAGDFLKYIQKSESARTELSMSWPLMIENPSPTKKHAQEIEEFVRIHRQLFEKGDAMFENRNTVSLPVMGQVYGPAKIKWSGDGKTRMPYILENIGTTNLKQVDIQVETTDGNPIENIWIKPDQITELSADKAVKFNLYITDKKPKQELIILRIESDDLRKVQTLRIIH